MAKKSFVKDIESAIKSTPTKKSSDSGHERIVYESTKKLTNARVIRLDLITPDPDQPRKQFDEESLKELAASLLKHGLLQPIVVEAMADGKFKLISGERRYRAARLAQMDEIPSLILSPSDSKDKFAKQIVENLVREDLNPIDKAYALLEYKNLLGPDATWAEVEESLAISETSRKQFIRLLNLPEEMQSKIVANSKREGGNQITEKHARALLLLNKFPDKQIKLFTAITDETKKITADEAIKRAQKIRDKKKEETEGGKLVIEYESRQDLIAQLKKKLAELEKQK